MNIVNIIRQETAPHSAKLALIDGPNSITYANLLQQITTLSTLLTHHNISPGHRIAFRCKDSIDYIIGSLALLHAGAAVVPLADALTPHEIDETLTRIDVNATLTHTSLINDPANNLTNSFHYQPRQTTDPTLNEKCQQLNAAFIRFSSGTTGQSKGVLLSHHSILQRTTAANRALHISPTDTILWPLAMAHHFVVTILLFLRQAATIIIANQRFPFSLLQAAQQHKPTFIYASPVHFYLLAVANQLPPSALSNVRMAISTSMKLPPATAKLFTQKFNLTPSEALGIIEIGLPFINTHPNPDSPHNVGQILPDYSLQIANPDENGIGELLLKGPGMFDAYFSPWKLRHQILADGWFHTGDLAQLDPQNHLHLLGRSKSVIVTAGMKVFPEEVELTLNSFPGIKESLVFPKPHPQFGQTPAAKIVLAPNISNKEQLLTHLRAHCLRELSSYKVPLDFTPVDSLPKTPTGKLLRTTPLD